MLDYKLKCKNEDFEVTEIPLLPPLFSKNSSSYTYLWLEKSGLTTFEAQEEIGEFFKVTNVDVNSEGLKDENAVTFQIVSLKKILSTKETEEFNKHYSCERRKLTVSHVIGYGKEPVSERMLHGNSFKIVIRNLDEDVAKKFNAFCANNRFATFINYYDSQRFGMAGGPYNAHLIGKAIVENNWQEAFLQFQKSRNALNLGTNDISIQAPAKEFFKTINPKKLSFFVSAYYSYLWNEAASLQLQQLNQGKFYSFENVGKLFLPSDHTFLSFNVCSIPGVNYFLETDRLVHDKIITRNLTVSPIVFPLSIEKDELHPGKTKLTVSFFLPSGCYATMLIRQLFFKLNL
ncbi:MAG: tRNA pseudouridine(13) synthase TruD [Patescibacteria group bacterium]|nr:tRNA pseudouridine(13) synthase TruD [Patescibacteria group bacterium]